MIAELLIIGQALLKPESFQDTTTVPRPIKEPVKPRKITPPSKEGVPLELKRFF